MSDVPPTPDGAVEVAPAESAGQATHETRPAPTQADLDKAYEKVREFEKDAYAHRRLREDPEYQREFLAEIGYRVDDDEPGLEEPDEGLDEYEDPRDVELRQVKSQVEEINEERELAQIAAHVAELTQDSDLDLETQRLIFELASGPERSIARTEKIVKQYVSAVETAKEKAVEAYLESKRSPTPTPAGTSGEQAPDLRDPTTRREHLATIVAAKLAEG